MPSYTLCCYIAGKIFFLLFPVIYISVSPKSNLSLILWEQVTDILDPRIPLAPTLLLQCLPYQAFLATRSVLGLVGPGSVCRDLVRSATSVSVWQRVQRCKQTALAIHQRAAGVLCSRPVTATQPPIKHYRHQCRCNCP